MRGASAESLAALTDELGPSSGFLSKVAGWAAKVTGGGDAPAGELDAERTAEDFFGVADVLRREKTLRRTLTDASLPAEAKSGLVRQIFGSALSRPALEVVEAAVARKWTEPRDLADAMEHLGVVSAVRGAEQREEAEALESELFAFERIVADSPELRDALSDPVRSNADKRGLIEALLGGRATTATIQLAVQAVSGSHRTVALAIEDYRHIAAEHRDRLIATVVAAHDLAEDAARRLSDVRARQYGRPVHVDVRVDPDVIGGLRVQIGDDVIDGTVVSRLDDARRRLAG